jgi:hypothetical protein
LVGRAHARRTDAVAAAIIALRANDGAKVPLVDPEFAQGTVPGEWRFTPGSPPVAFGAGWGRVKPFALRSAAQFRPGPLAVSCSGRHPAGAGDCAAYAADLEEVRQLRKAARHCARQGDGLPHPPVPRRKSRLLRANPDFS